MRPEIDEFGDEVVYKPFFKNDTLGKKLGYSDPLPILCTILDKTI